MSWERNRFPNVENVAKNMRVTTRSVARVNTFLEGSEIAHPILLFRASGHASWERNKPPNVENVIKKQRVTERVLAGAKLFLGGSEIAQLIRIFRASGTRQASAISSQMSKKWPKIRG